MVNIEELLQQGITLAGKGKLRDALATFEMVLDIHPDESRALYNAAVMRDLLGQRNTVLPLLYRSIDSDHTFANPHYYLGKLYLREGHYAEAYNAFRAAITRDVEFTPAYDGIQKAASAMSKPVVIDADRADVVFYTGGQPFHGETLMERGLGGSESALIYMARTLAENGVCVRVFCNCDRSGVYQGVRYDDLVDFHIYRKFYPLQVLISSRSVRPFKVAMHVRKRILWIHDDIYITFLENDNPASLPVDRIFAISQWQRNEWSRHFHIPIERFFLTRNGVDLTLFKPAEKKDKYRLVYVSRPDRGLDVLLRLFPYIRNQIPNAELHLYTYRLPDDRPDDSLLQMAQQPGVFMRGSLSKPALSAEMAVARLMVYPSTFRETSCISAIEAQASGTPVVASSLAALPETVQDGVSGYLIPGEPHTEEFGRRFVDAVVSLLNDETQWQRLSEGAFLRSRAIYDWRVIARDWLKELQRISKSGKLKD